MSDGHRKKKAPLPPAQYHPAAAVKRRGDSWRFGVEVWRISPATWLATGDIPRDYFEANDMLQFEKGERDRA